MFLLFKCIVTELAVSRYDIITAHTCSLVRVIYIYIYYDILQGIICGNYINDTNTIIIQRCRFLPQVALEYDLVSHANTKKKKSS